MGSVLAKATSTPLASIFGSGFLVIVPILAGAVGHLSVIAMAGVCCVAFAVGSVIRFNIAHAEPVLADSPGEATLSLERASDLALVLAYVISVCLYLHILSAFVLAGLGIDTPLGEDLLTSFVIVVIVAIGILRGLGSLEVLEQWVGPQYGLHGAQERRQRDSALCPEKRRQNNPHGQTIRELS